MRRDDGTYRTYDEMIAEGIPTFYEGYWKATLRNNEGEVQHCTDMDGATGQGYPFANHMFGIFLAEVAVETKTGKTTVEKFTLCGDVGKINNFLVVDGQQMGGIAQGIGLALTENFADVKKHKQSRRVRLPLHQGRSRRHSIDPHGNPPGIRPLRRLRDGEMPLSAPHAAVGNAICNAVGPG